MIDKRLSQLMQGSNRYIAYTVVIQWISLLMNIISTFAIANLIARLFWGSVEILTCVGTALVIAGNILVRVMSDRLAARMSYLASVNVREILREKLYQKLLRLGASYHEKVPTSEVVQVSVEGVEQLEVYFGKYLPQLFYSLLAPVTLFAVLVFVSPKAALVLLICVPAIPVSIIAVQKFAKKLLQKYWGIYTELGDSFLENLQGLTTLKIYQADGAKAEEMDREAEKFRKITMKVLTMQLNSVSVMDIIAFGGAALGIIVAVIEYQKGSAGLAGTLAVILLSAEFFIPLRLLGSFFHIAMNGMAASDKIFRILELEEETRSTAVLAKEKIAIDLQNVSFSYEEERPVLKGVSMKVDPGTFVSIVGRSGCGKSTIASLMMGKNLAVEGSVRVGETEILKISEENLMKNLTLVTHQSYLFKGTVEENLKMGNPNATEEEMWASLEHVDLAEYLRENLGLKTKVLEKASNLSGGQRQRLALARALLHDTPVYIFDEATSNIDVESENRIMEVIRELAKRKTVVMISHRLANVVDSDTIYVMEKGCIVQSGTHTELLQASGVYRRLYESQQKLEQYGMEEIQGREGERKVCVEAV